MPTSLKDRRAAQALVDEARSLLNGRIRDDLDFDAMNKIIRLYDKACELWPGSRIGREAEDVHMWAIFAGVGPFKQYQEPPLSTLRKWPEIT